MNVNNNSNIASTISASISKLHLNTAKRAFEQSEKREEAIQENTEIKEQDTSLISENIKKNNKVDVEDIQKYANYMGENLSIDDINYGLMYGRSVIADYSV